MDLTLNDFRNILGKVNDGDAVFTKDNNGNTTGIEKANYGRLRTHNVKGVSADDSVMIREEFVAAIRRRFLHWRAVSPEQKAELFVAARDALRHTYL